MLLLCGGASRAPLPLREARWLQSSDLGSDLTVEPAECRRPYPDAVRERVAEIGRIAFRAPLLLGGQAARVGLSCSSCHRNGRTNRDFHFPGLSGNPGTADVTSSLMSSHRGDGQFNPKPIPDLAGDPAKLKVSRDPRRRDLEQFIHGLITQEFDGPEPPPGILRGLAAYVRSLSPAACPRSGSKVVRVAPMLEDVATAVRLARESALSGDSATAHVLVSAARSMLGSINERFEVPGGDSSQRLLRETDFELRLLDPADGTQFRQWQRSWARRAGELRAAEPISLYSQAVIRRSLDN